MELQRYEMGDYCSGYVPNDDGEVCMSYDVRRLEESHAKMVELLKEARLVVDGVCDEYKAYRPLLNKIDKVLNNIEGTK